MKTKTVPFLIVVLTGMSLTAPAHAYLDPGTGSILLQLLFGGVAGALVVVKVYWQRIKAFMLGPKGVESEAPRTAEHD